MNLNPRIFALIFLSVLLLSVIFSAWLFAPKVESAQEEKFENEIVNYDIRTDKTVETRKTFDDFIRQANKTVEAIALDRKSLIEAEKRLREKIRSLKIEQSETLDIPEVISPDIGLKSSFLTPPANAEKSDILRSFVRQNSALFGLSDAQISALETSANYTNPDGNLSYVHFEQKINDIPVFQGEVKAGLTKRGEIIRVINNLAPNLISENVSDNFGNPQTALVNAAKHIGIAANENELTIINSKDSKITFERGQFADRTTSEKIYFPLESGVVRPAWRVILWTENAVFYLVVDGETGTLLWRKNITENQTQPTTYNVYGNTTSMIKTAINPIPSTFTCNDPNNCPTSSLINRQSFTLVGNEPPYNFNNNGWINDGENRTIGNNVEAGIDRMSPNGIDDNGWAFGNPNRNFVYTYNPAPGNPAPGEEPLPQTQTYPPSPFQQGSITNAFYTVNRWHDETYLLGFNEAARNYQTDNFGRGGLGNDSMIVEVQDVSGTNGANFTTPPDGARPRLQLFIWTGTTPARDGALDNQIIIHEATHGLSSRLHGNAGGLSSNMARGMGEGWSDFYALAMMTNYEDSLFGTYSIGCYSTLGVPGFNCYHGIRRFPTAIKRSLGANNLPHNPLTFKNIGQGNCASFSGAFPPRTTTGACDQIHNLGEVWNVALWEIRAYLIEKHGAVVGNRRALQYITDGMKLSPLNPTMLQSRDAILFAAQASNPADLTAVWRGFAVRGMGFSASIQNAGTGSNNALVTEAFNLPNSLLGTKRADFDGDGKSDLSVFRPSEGNWYLNRSTAGFSVINWGISSDVPVPGDYDGDGKTDFAIFRATADSSFPDFYILNSSNFTFSGYSWGLPEDIPVIADYDGDGKSDIAVFRPSNSTFYVLKSGDGGVLTYSRVPPGFRPVAGDFDGDGKADFTYFNQGQWRIAKSSDNYQSAEIVFWGLDSDKLVPADYDGDGIDDVAVYRPSDGVWYIRKSSGGNMFRQFGISTDIPVPGDYDGDGIDDIAVYRNGIWYVNQSTSGVLISQFGLSVDLPVSNKYLP